MVVTSFGVGCRVIVDSLSVEEFVPSYSFAGVIEQVSWGSRSLPVSASSSSSWMLSLLVGVVHVEFCWHYCCSCFVLFVDFVSCFGYQLGVVEGFPTERFLRSALLVMREIVIV